MKRLLLAVGLVWGLLSSAEATVLTIGQLEAEINSEINSNGQQAITGTVLNGVLIDMTQTLSVGGGSGNVSTTGGTTGQLAQWTGAYTIQSLSINSCSGANNALTWTGSAFGCNTISGGGAVSSVSNSDGSLSVSPTTGAVIAALNSGHANSWSAAQTFGASDIVLTGAGTGCATFTSGVLSGTGTACGGSLSFPVTVGGTTTSGGVPYFSSTTQISSSGLLAANALMVGGGAGAAPSTVTTGTGVVTALGIAVNNASGLPLINSTLPTNGHCLQWGSTGITDAGGACTTGGGGGTVSSGNANQLAYYASTGTVVSGLAAGTGAQFLVINGSAIPTFVTASGDCTISSAGAFSCLAKPLNFWTAGGSNVIGGTSSAMTVTLNQSGYSFSAGNVICAFSGVTNALGATLNVSGTGATPVFSTSPSGLVSVPAGAIRTGQVACFEYDGTNYEYFTSPSSGSGGSSAPYTNAVATCGADNTGVADSTTAINNCLSTYGSVALTAGTYLVSSCLNLNLNGSLVGSSTAPANGTTSYAGAAYSTVGGVTIKSNSTTSSVVCSPNGFSGRISNLFITKSVTASAGCGLDFAAAGVTNLAVIEDVYVEKNYYGVCPNLTSYSTIKRVLALNNLSHGFYFRSTFSPASSIIYQWVIEDNVSEFNEGAGFYVNCPTGATNCIIGTPWIQNQSYANTGGGFWFIASGTANVNDIELISNVGSSDGSDELRITGSTSSGASGVSAKISGGLYESAGLSATGNFNGSSFHDAASNVGYGINISYMISVSISNSFVQYNSYDGIILSSISSVYPTEYANITGALVFNNSHASSGTYSGINITGSQVYSASIINNTPIAGTYAITQKYGIVVTNSNSSSVAMITGNSAQGTVAGCGIVGTTTLKPSGSAAAYNNGLDCP